MSDFIDLDRHFHPLPTAPKDDGTPVFRSLWPSSDDVGWPEMLEHRIVILLAEAGAGKTAEMRQAAIRVRREGKAAFFLRLEHVAAGFTAAFEIGDADDLDTWRMGTDDAWFFVDSVDEYRLRGPHNFEAAIRVFASRVVQARARAHVVINGPVNAWRHRSDRAFVKDELGQHVKKSRTCQVIKRTNEYCA